MLKMRDPGLHITKSKLARFIKEWNNDDTQGIKVNLVDYIMKRGILHASLNRSILDPEKDTQRKSLSRLSSAKMDDSTLFNKLLSDVRIQMKHRGFKRIDKFDSDWPFIVELSNLCNGFCSDFGLERKLGYIEYIKGYFYVRPGGFRVRQMKAFHEQIISRYQNKILIQEDENPKETEEAYHLYQNLVYDKVGVTPKYDKDENPEKYLCFVKVSKEARGIGLTTEDYVLAQFETLDWTGGFPTPEQMTTVNAKDRVLKWMSENKLTTGRSKDVNKDKALVEFRKIKADLKKQKRLK